MAYTFTTIPVPAPRFKGFAALRAAMGARLVRAFERRARLDELARLEALSDAELAAQGLTRARIVQHVFRDKMYL